MLKKKLALTGVVSVTAAGMMLAATPAHADTNNSGAGILSGIQIPITASIPICGVQAVALLSGNNTDCKGAGTINQVDQSKR